MADRDQPADAFMARVEARNPGKTEFLRAVAAA